MSDRRVLLTETHLEDIAGAIREKLSSHDTYRPGQMAEAIRQITGDPPLLEPLTATVNGSYAPSAGVDGFDSATVAVPTFTAAVEGETIVLTGGPVSVENETVAVAGPTFIHRTITEDGTYIPADDGADGYSGVTVEVPGDVGEKVITENGDYEARVDGLDGYSFISVRVGGVAWIASAIVDTEFPYGEFEGVLDLSALTFDADASADGAQPYEEITTTFALSALTWAAEAQEEE